MPNSSTAKRFPSAAIALALVAVLALPSLVRAQERPIKIAVVNLDYVASQSKAGQKLQADLVELGLDIIGRLRGLTINRSGRRMGNK